MNPALTAAIATARQHIPIQRAVHLDPRGFVIIDKGERLAVYNRCDYEDGQAPGGILPPSPIIGTLIGYVGMDGTWLPV
jgi:hypothetical protein